MNDSKQPASKTKEELAEEFVLKVREFQAYPNPTEFLAVDSGPFRVQISYDPVVRGSFLAGFEAARQEHTNVCQKDAEISALNQKLITAAGENERLRKALQLIEIMGTGKADLNTQARVARSALAPEESRAVENG